MDLELTGNVAVVTGASKGIGLAAVLALRDEGALVVGSARDVSSLQELEHVSGLALDLTAPDGPKQLIDHVLDEHGRVDILVNNVGAVRMRIDGFLATSDDEFDWAMKMNFFTTLRATRAALPAMIEQRAGAIVNVASVNAFFQPDSRTIDYGAAKAGVVSLTKSLSQEFGDRGIRVNAISPGPVSTELWLGEHGVAETIAEASGVDPETVRKQVVDGVAGVPTGRFTKPEEVAALIAFLASERSGNTTGVNYVIDGGLIKTT
jgi:NAD(P)-dependent dehydrogenase (short-subunit alcohol dehydrogenase family)